MFSNRVMLQVTAVALALLLAGSIMQNRSSKGYVYERVDRDLEEAIGEMEDINEALFGTYMEQDFEGRCSIPTDYIYSLSMFDEEIERVFDVPKRQNFRWYDIVYVKWNIDGIVDKLNLSKNDEQFLESAHKYNKRLIDSYYEILDENKTDTNDISRDKAKIKKIYRQFISKANDIASEQEYKDMVRYSPDDEAGENGRKISIREKQAKEMASGLLERLFGEKPVLEKVNRNGDSEYELCNSWDDGRDEDMYNISIDKENGRFHMYKRSQTIIHGLKEEDLDKKAGEIREIFVSEGYVFYDREKRIHDGELYGIDYRFINKTGDVYDESHMVKFSINSSGALSDLYISDAFGRFNMEVPKAGISKEEILFTLKRGDVENAILVKTIKGQLEYRVFVEFGQELYTISFDADAGESVDFKKSENLYFKRVNN